VTIPINRVVAFLGPWIALVSTAITTWLIAHVNILGIPGIDHANTATYVAGALTALITAGLQALGGWAWLKGHHIQLQGDAEVAAAALAPVPYEPERETALDEDAELADPNVSDEEEFASPPPPDESNTPVQPSQEVPGA